PPPAHPSPLPLPTRRPSALPLNWKQVRPILSTPAIASAVTDERYQWTIYLAGLAVDAYGKRYTKGVEVAAGQPYRADELAAVMQDRKSTRLNSSHVKMSYAV